MSVLVRIKPDNEGGWVGTITVISPESGGVGDSYGHSVINVASVGDTKADALHKAALLAERIVTDPVMAAILPPQAAAAIAATKKLAGAAKQGRSALLSVWRRLRGPGKQRVAKALAQEQSHEAAVSEVGFLPMAMLAAKYGPAAAKAAYGAYKKRKAKKAAAKKARRAAPRRRPPPVAPEPQDEEPMDEEPEPMPEPEAPPPEGEDAPADNGVEADMSEDEGEEQ